MTRRIAVIDTGTNSTRLLVADIEDGLVKEEVREAVITRLGEDVERNGRLKDEAMERVRKCFSGYMKIVSFLETDSVVILATSSVRGAVNGEEFIASLARNAAAQYKILSGNEEAELSFAGATLGLKQNLRIMMMDVGGGSTEIAVGSRGRAEYAASFGLGCVRLTEAYLRSDPPKKQELDSAAVQVDKLIAENVNQEITTGIDRTVAVAGTATSLAAIDLGLDSYDRQKVHGHVLSRAGLQLLMERLTVMSTSERLKIKTLPKGRADVIVGGALILLRLMDYAGVKGIQISENDILDGAALRFAEGVFPQ